MPSFKNAARRPARLRLPLFLSSLVGAASLIGPGIATAATSWAATATRVTTLPAGAALVSPLDATTPLHVVVGLAPRDRAGIASVIEAQATPGNPAYHQYLTPAQFTASYSATADAVTLVQQYLQAQGFTNIVPAANRLYIEATAPVGVVETAFNTQLARYSLNGRDVFANTADAQVPQPLAGIVTGIVGLQTVWSMHSFLGRPTIAAASLQAPPVTMTPSKFQTFYDVGTVPEASNTVLAIFTEGDMTQDLKDIVQFRTEQKLPPVPITVVRTGVASTDTSGDGEWDMDIATSTGLAGNVKELLLYATASLNDADLIPNFNHFVMDNKAVVGTASFGGCTVTEMTAGGLDLYDTIFQAAATQGQSVFASSGDVGSSCPVVGVANGVPGAGLPDQSYPASSPYVMGVGGTTLFVNSDNSYNMEISWDAGGGGPEALEFSPAWQQPVLPTAAVGSTLPVSFRGVPDVAMDADFLLSPAAYVLDGADTSNGGTSLASPLMAGCYSRLQSLSGNTLGPAGPLFYKLFATAGTPTATINAMHDIKVGANGLYTALPGYDFNTGLGTCDIAMMAKLLPPAPASTGGSSGSSSGSSGSSAGSSSGSAAASGGGGGAFGGLGLVVLSLGALRRRQRGQR